jgi:hypothetical protein
MGANAWRFGFVMSYPRGAIAETCYEYEPWHYRYVGRWTAARIHDAEVTLRSWLWSRLQNRHRPLPAIAQRESLGYG